MKMKNTCRVYYSAGKYFYWSNPTWNNKQKFSKLLLSKKKKNRFKTGLETLICRGEFNIPFHYVLLITVIWNVCMCTKDIWFIMILDTQRNRHYIDSLIVVIKILDQYLLVQVFSTISSLRPISPTEPFWVPASTCDLWALWCPKYFTGANFWTTKSWA